MNEMCLGVITYYPKVDAAFCGEREAHFVNVSDSTAYRPDRDGIFYNG